MPLVKISRFDVTPHLFMLVLPIHRALVEHAYRNEMELHF